MAKAVAGVFMNVGLPVSGQVQPLGSRRFAAEIWEQVGSKRVR